MFRTRGTPKIFEDHIDMSIRETDGWYEFKDGAFVFNLVMIGDEEAGPTLSMLNAAPGTKLPVSPAHAHASDSFRIALKGNIFVDPKVYEPREFRFQEGWRVYPGHGEVAFGSEGMWEIVVMGDSRGKKMRPAVEIDPNPENELLKMIARDFGTVGDVLSDDPAKGAGPSAIASTLAPKLRMGKLDGSYANSADWDEVASGVRATFALMGDPVKGPVIICTDAAANACAMPRSKFGTEVLRLIVDGSCRIGDMIYNKGDLRVQKPESWCAEVHALDSGLKELIILGDRRCIAEETAAKGWPQAVPQYVENLKKMLANRAQPIPVTA